MRIATAITALFAIFSIYGLAQPVAGTSPEAIYVDGLTMGTSYHVTYFDALQRNFKSSIDSLLLLVNKSISTFDQTSEISRFNRSDKNFVFDLPYFYPPLKKAQEVYYASGGAFDPTVMPLIGAWGFGPKKKTETPRSVEIDSILTFVGFDKIFLNEKAVGKADARMALDFGGIGQGYGADVIADFLRLKGIENFLVELGGEGLAAGKNLAKGQPWTIGILDPNSTREDQFFKAYVTLENRSFTTSGNYFNYREVDGKKYGHTLNPKTGYPVQTELLSVSLFSDDCTTVDAWATAFMVMGLQKTIDKLATMPSIDALLIYSSPTGAMETFITPNLKHSLRLEP